MAAYFSNQWQQITPNVSILSDGDSIQLRTWKPSWIYAVISQWKILFVFLGLYLLNAFFGLLHFTTPTSTPGVSRLNTHGVPLVIIAGVIIFWLLPRVRAFMSGFRAGADLRGRIYFNLFLFACLFLIASKFMAGGQAIRTNVAIIFAWCCAVYAVYRIFRIRAIQYMLTNEQIVARQGLVSKTAHYIELYRVKDIIINQNIFERIFGLMSVSIISIDAATPVFTMCGLPYAPELQLQMRDLAQQCRMKYNVYSIN